MQAAHGSYSDDVSQALSHVNHWQVCSSAPVPRFPALAAVLAAVLRAMPCRLA